LATFVPQSRFWCFFRQCIFFSIVKQSLIIWILNSSFRQSIFLHWWFSVIASLATVPVSAWWAQLSCCYTDKSCWSIQNLFCILWYSVQDSKKTLEKWTKSYSKSFSNCKTNFEFEMTHRGKNEQFLPKKIYLWRPLAPFSVYYM